MEIIHIQTNIKKGYHQLIGQKEPSDARIHKKYCSEQGIITSSIKISKRETEMSSKLEKYT